MPRETVRRQREREEREGSVISIRRHSRQTQREFYSGERDLREHLERRAQQAILGEIQVRENYTQLSTTWRSKFWNEKIQNTHYSIHSASLNLKDDIFRKQISEQIKLGVREYTCVVNWR